MNKGTGSTHPSVEKLRTFGLGRLQEPEASAVEAHVERCEPCCRTLASLASDTLTGLLRGARQAASAEAATIAPEGVPPRAGADTADGVPDGVSVPVPPSAERPMVPGYQILGVLGRGGMGVVYKARQVGLNRVVALKMVLDGAHSSPEALVRFVAEAEAVAHLQHPNIVQIHHIGRQGDVPFFSLEYVAGGTLAQRLGGVPQQPRDAAKLVECLARAMHFAHQRGIVHRDLKPANILLANEDCKSSGAEEPAGGTPPPLGACVPKITDFGLAKRVEGDHGLTRTGAIMGTPSYMAPEQAQGAKEVGPAADVYALGALLYELLTGRPPFQAPTPIDTVLQVLSSEPVAPTRLQPGCPRDLETVCLKCLHKEPARRYATAEALAEDLQRFLTDRPILARRTRSLERFRRWCRRNPVVAGMTAAVALLLVLLAAGSLLAALWLNGARDAAEGNLDRAVRAEQDTQEQLWHSLVDQARAGRFSQRVGQRFKSLEALARAARMARERAMPAERFDEMRNLAVGCLALPDLRTREWDGWPEGSVGLDFNAPRALYARTDERGNVSVRRLDDDAEVGRLAGEGVKVHPHFSPDGRLLLLREAGPPHRIHVWRLGEDRPRAAIAETADASRVVVSPDGRWFAVAHGNKAVHLYDLPDGQRTVLPPVGDVLHLQFSANGRWLGISYFGSGIIHVRDLAAGTSRLLHSGKNDQIAFQPGGDVLAAGAGPYGKSDRRVVRLFDLTTAALTAELPHGDGVESLTWHPDGKTLAVGTTDASLLYLWDVPTRTLRKTISSHKGGALQVYVNGTGDLLATWCRWGGGIRLWHPHTGRELLRSPEGSLEDLRPAPDGRMLQLKAAGRKLRLLEIHPGREFRTLVPGAGVTQDTIYFRAAVHPGGRLAAVATSAGLILFDLAAGDTVHHFRTGITQGVFFDRAGTLAVSGRQGAWRLPLPYHPAAPDRVRVGPAQLLLPPGNRAAVAASSDGRALIIAHSLSNGADLVRPGPPAKSFRVEPHHDVRFVSITPDGRLAATGSHSGGGVRVWDTETRRQVKALPCKSGATPGFSPEGVWLAVASAGRTRLFEVGPWREVLQLDGNGVSFTPDGRFLAVEQSDALLRLHEIPSGREVVQLDNPQQLRSGFSTFSPDGRLLLFVSNDMPGVHVWDLHAVRRGLAELGLDWSDAPLPPHAKETNSAVARLRVTLDPSGASDLISAPALFAEANRMARFGRWKAAAQNFSRALKVDPSNHWYWYASAPVWLELGDVKEFRRHCEEMLRRFGQTRDPVLADRTAKTCLLVPDLGLDLKPVLLLAQRAVDGTENHMYYDYFQLAKGLAEYRAGHFPSAIDWLRKSDRKFAKGPAHPGAYARLVLAMAYARVQPAELGKARASLAEAVAIMDSQFPNASASDRGASWNDWLQCQILRREAEALLRTLDTGPAKPDRPPPAQEKAR